jgi:NAD+ synthase (glutamine-hydrolysing)
VKNNLRVALAQINCTVGDLEGNRAKIKEGLSRAVSLGADIVAFPELAITGYPPEDLLLKPKFISDNIAVLKELAASVGNIAAVVGFVDKKGKSLYNAAAVAHNGKIKGIYHKALLPNYGVFDEKRYFAAGDEPLVFSLRAGKLIFGVNICEDIWGTGGLIKQQALMGAKLIVNINASPYHAGKIKIRQEVIKKQAKTNHVAIAYTNMVGGQDELVFDGQSIVVDNKGNIISKAEAFKEDLLVTDLSIPESKPRASRKIIKIAEEKAFSEKPALPKRKKKELGDTEEIYSALALGLRDYCFKNGFQKVVIGLSGGIDSSLVAALAADALGKENVSGVFMSTRYSSKESEADAELLAVNLGIKFIKMSIEQIYNMYLLVFEPHFAGMNRNITEENIQARIRGNILMAFSNKFGWMVLTTGNKSEMSTGYATLYGDMAGGLAVIKDVPKELVYKLARYRNTNGAVIPESVLTKAPTAELRHNQKDSDTLPVYERLDPILKAYVEEDKDLSKIVSLGFDEQTVSRVISLVDKSEYKRRQSPPGIKITPEAFGRDRRMPITNKYKAMSNL